MSNSDIKTFLLGCAVVCSVLAVINLIRRDRLFLGLAFISLAGTNFAYATTLQLNLLYLGGGITVILLIIDIWNRLGAKSKR